MKLKIGIVSAEPSGDLLGAELIESLNEKFDIVEVIGVGSGPLKKYSVEDERKELEIMGLLSGSGFTKVALISEPYKER